MKGALLMKVRITKKTIVVVVMVGLVFFVLAQAKKPAAFYCKYCGHKASSVSSLTASLCMRHPNGPGKGKHSLYEGSEKEQYICKYCGRKANGISSLTASKCIRHPNGPAKGNHEPAL